MWCEEDYVVIFPCACRCDGKRSRVLTRAIHGCCCMEGVEEKAYGHSREGTQIKNDGVHTWGRREFGVYWLIHPFFRLALLPSSPVSQAFFSPWPWYLCHICRKPQASPRMGKAVGSLVNLPWSWFEDNLSPFDKSPSSSMSKIILNILGLSLRARSVTDFSPLKDHLSELVGYSSPKSPEGRVLGVWGVGGLDRNTGSKVSQQVLQLQFIPKVGGGGVDLEKGQPKLQVLRGENPWLGICHLSSIWSTLQYSLILTVLVFGV